MSWRVVAVITVIALVIVYAVGSGRWVSTSGDWYLSLEKPPWQPPPWVFGLIWPYNFLMLIVVGAVLSLQAPGPRVAWFVGLLAITVTFALTWAYLFYVPHALIGAALALSATALLTVPLLVISYQQALWIGLVLTPYQVWLVLAASLSWAYSVSATTTS